MLEPVLWDKKALIVFDNRAMEVTYFVAFRIDYLALRGNETLAFRIIILTLRGSLYLAFRKQGLALKGIR